MSLRSTSLSRRRAGPMPGVREAISEVKGKQRKSGTEKDFLFFNI